MIMRYLTRCDYRKSDGRIGSRGYIVRVPGAPARFFSVGIWGGWGAARDAALAYRDDMADRRGIRILNRRMPALRQPTGRNRSGIVGVTINETHKPPQAVASWSPAVGVSKRKAFTYAAHGGRAGAIDAAGRERNRQVRRIFRKARA